MNIKYYKLLHYMLILLLMLAPLRSVMAISPSQCDMDDKPAAHDMAAMMLSDKTMDHQTTVVTDTADVKHECCCCDDGSCAGNGNCDMGMSLSLIMQQVSFSTVIIDISQSAIISSSILIGALTPPSRPPEIVL